MSTEETRHELLSEEDRLRTMRDDLRTDSGDANALSEVEQHSADAAGDQMQREVDLSILEQVEAELTDVERAMRKLEEGTYGVCESCTKPIDVQRLEAQPATRYCSEHASR